MLNEHRRRGLLLIVGGVVVGVALFVGILALQRIGWIAPSVKERVVNGVTIRTTKYSGIWAVPAIVPLFSTLLGTIQLLTGRSLTRLGEAYETMSGGRRFIVSVLVIALAFGAIVTLGGIAVVLMS